ncbi:MAG: hypothetical protein ACJ8F1_09565 [Polyangia bacterium]
MGAAIGVPVEPLAGCSPGVVRTLAAISVSALIFAALVDSAIDPSRSFLARADAALRRHWTAFVPPLAFLLLPSRLVPARPIIVAASFVLAAWSARDAPAPLTIAPSRPLWPAALLVTAGCICVAYVLVGRTVAWNTDNDPAYYFGVARHIVTAHRFDEPIVWHFLVKPPAVAHPPFDYWAMLPALALVPFFFLFGPTHHVAGAVMALVSGLSIVGFAYLVGVAAPFRSRLIQLIALLLFAFAPALMRFRFDVETVTFVHLWTVAALICLARGRWEAAVVVSFLIFLSRSESVVLTAILWGAAGLAAARSADARRLRRVLAAALTCAAAYVAGCFALFHTPVPPGTLLGLHLTDYGSLYRWNEASPSTWTLVKHLTPEYLAGRVEVALSTLLQTGFFANYPVWLALLLIRGCRPLQPGNRLESVTFALLFGGAAAVTFLNPTVFSPWRSPHALLPVFALGGGLAADALLAAAPERLSLSAGARRFRVALVRPSLLLLLALAMLWPLKLSVAAGNPLSFAPDVAGLDAMLDGKTTMSQVPWSVLADTHSPAVSLPIDGEAAIEAVARRYGVQWLLLINDECGDASRDICRELAAGTRRNIGGITATRRWQNGPASLFQLQ